MTITEKYEIDRSKKLGYDWAESENNYLNKEEEDEMEIYGYQKSEGRTVAVWICVVLTLGALRLVFHWWPEWMLYLTHRCSPLAHADKVLIVDKYERRYTSLFIKDVKKISTKSERLERDFEQTSPMGQRPQELSTVAKPPSEDKFEIYLSNSVLTDVTNVRAIWVKKLCYIWNEEKKTFLRLVGLDQGVTKARLHSFKGYNIHEQSKRRNFYGSNEILVNIQSIATLVLLEILNPFYIFQIFTICVWIAEQYLYYSVAIVIMSLFGVSSSVLQTYQNQKNLNRTVHTTDVVTVKRGEEEYDDIPTTQLVPGDVIVIPSHGCIMHCDAALLVGNCIVNESMLTGESVPVTKTALPKENVLYSETEDANHTLFCGTRVLQTRYYGNEKVHAVVLRTGFLTSKGGLVRSILYPPPADFKFDQDSYKFIWILAFIALLGLLYTILTKYSRGLSPGDIVLKALDIITIVIPPALPATMTIGKLYALNRLQKHKISCINSRVINVSGSIDCVCFDKTGTLTEDGMDMWGVVPSTDARLSAPLRKVNEMPFSPLIYAMASCHSLTIIDGMISGDPLDVKMFESTSWIFEEPEIADSSKYDLMVPSTVRPPKMTDPAEPIEIGIIHQYQFSSKLQRMSVLTRTLGSKDLIVYCKGSPEIIQSLSVPHTVPPNLMTTLQEYTKEGYRVIAVGYRKLQETDYIKVQKMSRSEIEKDLIFVGLIILENRLKPQTTGVISVLKEAQIKVVMITGDNILTALSVAKECGIIEAGESVVEVTAEEEENNSKAPQIHYSCGGNSMNKQVGSSNPGVINHDYEIGPMITAPYKIAISGKSWAVIRDYYPELIPRIVVKGAVFARMSSEQKQQLVQELQQLGYYVAMCGDGANDCSALKAAHAGISLSEAEASVASPFTSAEANISCVPRVIREGRAALVTSFGVFKFMVLYSLMEFMSTVILYSIDSNLTDFEFLFIDLGLVVNLAFFFGRNKACSAPLSPQVPLTSLLSLIPLMSLFLQFVLMTSLLLLSFNLIHLYSWFEPFHYVSASYYISYENYAVYSLSQFQYIIMAFIFSQGAPFREPVYTNKIFFSSMCLMTCICIYITLSPAQWVINFLQLRFPPSLDFPLLVIGLALCNLVLSAILESFVIQYLMFQKLRYFKHNISKSRRKFLAVAKELDGDKHWPPLSTFNLMASSDLKNGISGNVNHAFEEDMLRSVRYNTKL